MSSPLKYVNAESPDLPSYLSVGKGQYYSRNAEPSPPKRPEKKYFPNLNYGVSPDAPTEFKTHDGLTNYSKARYDPFGDYGEKKPEFNTINGDARSNIVRNRSPKNVQLVQNFSITEQFRDQPQKTKPLKAQQVYEYNLEFPYNNLSCILDQTKVMRPPDMPILDRDRYKEKYEEQIHEVKAFHKKHGYFLDYSRRNKLLLDQYKNDSTYAYQHSRYVSKPIIITTLHTKNNLSRVASQDHSKLLSNGGSIMPDRVLLNVSQRNSGKVLTHSPSVMKELSPLHKKEKGNRSARSLEGQSVIVEDHHDSPNRQLREKTSKIDPIIPRLSNGEQGEPTPRSPSIIDNSMIENLGIIKDSTKTIDILYSSKKKAKHNASQLSQRSRSTSMKHSHKAKSQALLGVYNNSIKLDRVHSQKLLDPDTYMKHEKGIENERDNNIIANFLLEEQEMSRFGNGSPHRYMSVHHKSRKATPTVEEEIDAFERKVKEQNLQNPHIGTQRWMYHINWDWKQKQFA